MDEHDKLASLNAVPQAPWWRYPLLWMVLSGPAAVIVASAVTLWLALRAPDPIVTSRASSPSAAPDAMVERDAMRAGKTLLPALAGRNHAATPDADLPPAAPPRR